MQLIEVAKQDDAGMRVIAPFRHNTVSGTDGYTHTG